MKNFSCTAEYKSLNIKPIYEPKVWIQINKYAELHAGENQILQWGKEDQTTRRPILKF